MAGLRKKRRTTKQALLRRAVIKAGRIADDTIYRSALYDVPQTRSSPQAKAITVLPSFNKDAQMVHIMQRSLSNNSGSSWEPRGAQRILRIKPNRTEAKLQHLLLETPFRTVEQRKEAGNVAVKKLSPKKPNTNDNRSGVSLKALEPSKGSKGSRASSLGYPSSWNLDVPGEDEITTVIANELSLSDIVNCEVLNRTVYDHRLNAPVTLRRPTKIDNAVQCVLPHTTKTATPRRKKAAGVQTQTTTKRRLSTPKPIQFKLPRLQRIRSRMFPIGNRRSISPTGIIRMDRLLGITHRGMRPRVHSGKADLQSESVFGNVDKNPRSKRRTSPRSSSGGNAEEQGTRKFQTGKDHNYGGYTPSDCSCETNSNESLVKQKKLTAAPKASTEHYSRIEKISQPPPVKERRNQKNETSFLACECEDQPDNQFKTRQAACLKVKCPNNNWDSRMTNEQRMKEAGSKAGTSGTSGTSGHVGSAHYCYCSQKKSSAGPKNVVFESQESTGDNNDTEQTQNSSSDQRFAHPQSDTKLTAVASGPCQCPKCSNAVTQTLKSDRTRGHHGQNGAKTRENSENSSEECICKCAECTRKGTATCNSKGTSAVCNCKCPDCGKAKSKSRQPSNGATQSSREGKTSSSDRSAKQSSRESRVPKPARETMHSSREARPSRPERRSTQSSREARAQSPVPGENPQSTVARSTRVKCQCPRAKTLRALREFNEYCICACSGCSNREQQPTIDADMTARERMHDRCPCECHGCRFVRKPRSPRSSSSSPRSDQGSPARDPISGSAARQRTTAQPRAASRRHPDESRASRPNYNAQHTSTKGIGKRNHDQRNESPSSDNSSNESIHKPSRNNSIKERTPTSSISSNQDSKAKAIPINKKVQCDCKCPNCGISINDFSRDERNKTTAYKRSGDETSGQSETEQSPNKSLSQTQSKQDDAARVPRSKQDDAARVPRNEQGMGANLYGRKRYGANKKESMEDTEKRKCEEECKICETILAKKKWNEMELKNKNDMESKNKYDMESKNKYDMECENKCDMEAISKYDKESKNKYDMGSKSKYDTGSKSKYDMEAKSKYDTGSKSKYDMDREHKDDMEAKTRNDVNSLRRPHCNLETCNRKCNKCKIIPAKTKMGDAMVNLVVDDKCNVNQIIQILQETVSQLEGQKKLLSQSVVNAVVTQNANINNVQKNYANGTWTSLNPNYMPEAYSASNGSQQKPYRCVQRQNCPCYMSDSQDQEQQYKQTAYDTYPEYNPFQQRNGQVEGGPQALRRNGNHIVYVDQSSLEYQPTEEYCYCSPDQDHDTFMAMDPNARNPNSLRSRSGSAYPLKNNAKTREILQNIKPTKSFIDMFHMAMALKGNKSFFHNPNPHASFYSQMSKDYPQYASNILIAAKREQAPGKQLGRDPRFYAHNATSMEHIRKHSPEQTSPKYPTSKIPKQTLKFSSHIGISDRRNSPLRLQEQSEQEQRHRRQERDEFHFFRKDNNDILEQHNREDLARLQPILCAEIHDKSKNPYFSRGQQAQRDLCRKHSDSEYTEVPDKSPCEAQVPKLIKDNPFLQKMENCCIEPPCEFRKRQHQDLYSSRLHFCRKHPKTSKVSIHRKRCFDKEFKYCSEFCCMEKPNRRDLHKMHPAVSVYGHSKSQSSFALGGCRHRKKLGSMHSRKISFPKLEAFASKHIESKRSQTSVVDAFRKKLQDLKENALQEKNSNICCNCENALQKYEPTYKVDLFGNSLDQSKSIPSKLRFGLYDCKCPETLNIELPTELGAKKSESKSDQSFSQKPNGERKVKEGPDLSESKKSEKKGILYAKRRQTGEKRETEESEHLETRNSLFPIRKRAGEKAETEFSDHLASKRSRSRTSLLPTRRRAGERRESEKSFLLASKTQSRDTLLLARRWAGEKGGREESDHFERNQSRISIGKRRISEKRAKEISYIEESKNSNSISFGVYSYLDKTKRGRKVPVEIPEINLANHAELESTQSPKLQGLLALGNRTKKDRKPVPIPPEKPVKKVVSISSGISSFKRRKSRRNSQKEQSDCDDVKVLYDSSYKFSKHSYGDADSNDDCETELKRHALFKSQPSSSQNNFFCMLKARDKYMGCHEYSN
ncbi:uncharacterized protein LOC135435446 [Drosophila montana]|uniref:uncharacterized protein LOC135435446 n=1 Tax=Drosophila montana TaxID=40370 RepID=UPI00313EFEE5